MYGPAIRSTVGVLNVDEMVMNSNATFSGLISVNNLNLNNIMLILLERTRLLIIDLLYDILKVLSSKILNKCSL